MTLTSTTPLHKKVFCIVGPSGAGKSVLTKAIPIPKVVSYRTRPIREEEIDGEDGHFISVQRFHEMSEQGLWIAETEYTPGVFYGITQGEILELEEKPMLYVIDWPGVERLKDAFDKIPGYHSSEIVTIFVHTPREDLEARMIRRGTSRDVIRARLDRADRDYAASSRCNYIVKNENGLFDAAAAEIMKIILKESF